MTKRTTARGLLALALGASCAAMPACSDKSKATDAQPSSSSSFSDLPIPSYALGDAPIDAAKMERADLDQVIDQARHATDDVDHARLVSPLALRYQMLRRSSDLSELFTITDAYFGAPMTAPRRLLRSQALAAAGRFKEALDLNDSVTSPAGVTHTPARVRLLLSLGRYDKAADPFALPARTDVGLLRLRALCLWRMGKIDEADEAFNKADVEYVRLAASHPVFLAWAALYFQRGNMWERQGDLIKATSLYKAALRANGAHVHAALHLAALVSPTEAKQLLTPLLDLTDDPDVSAGLAVANQMLKDGSGNADLEKARATYEKLLARFPEAYAERAGWFYLSIGSDPERAFAAAKIAVEAAPTSESYELALAATAASATRHDERCAFAAKAAQFPYPTLQLSQALRLVGDCGPR